VRRWFSLHGAPADTLAFVRKQCGQLASKMRFVSAQFTAMLEDGLVARDRGALQRHGGRDSPEDLSAAGVEITQPVDANEVFAVLPAGAVDSVTGQELQVLHVG
jgi:threonine aldolase